MPRLPIDYTNTVIYKIVCNDLNVTERYVGHTTDFARRKSNHKNRCNNIATKKKHNLNVYQIIRGNGGWDNYRMIEIEKYPCNDANEACAKEREWYEKISCKMNTNHPQRGKKEYREDNREEIAQKKKEHYENNRVELSVHNKDYYENNRVELLERVNKYREENKDIIRERNKIYRENNKDKIREKRSQMIVCECGREITCCKMSRHIKTKVHNDNLKISI